jgi:hypothetical protein
VIALVGRSPLADHADNAAFDLTLHGTKQWTKNVHIYPNVFYRSYAATKTIKSRYSKVYDMLITIVHVITLNHAE